VHIQWPEYSAAQFRAIAEALASAIAIAEHGHRVAQTGARIDPTGAMAETAAYYRHAARYCRWLASHLERSRERAIQRERNHGNGRSSAN
jgi:hypothetical protein